MRTSERTLNLYAQATGEAHEAAVARLEKVLGAEISGDQELRQQA